MIRLIEALNYRCLRYVRQELGSFQILVGPNASGKSTFLDVFAFLGDLLSLGLDETLAKRSANFQDLIWMRSVRPFELAVELNIPKDRLERLESKIYDRVRYEIQIGADDTGGEISILAEKALLLEKGKGLAECPRQLSFPSLITAPNTIISPKAKKGQKTIINKTRGGNDNYYGENKGYQPSFKLGPRKSALANLPEDESKFPVTTWLKRVVSQGIHVLALNSAKIRLPSPPGQRTGFKLDGSNLPWLIEELKHKNSSSFVNWLAHLKATLPDLEDVTTVERPEDKHRYLMVRYANGLTAPSWTISDGSLRLLALTILAYLPKAGEIYLIEEPENGVHPIAIESIYQSLSSVYDSQVLLATHSPVILSLAQPSELLCFAKNEEGATDVVTGDKHPKLRDWRGSPNLSILFAGGVLG